MTSEREGFIIREGFHKFGWGFLFILFDFRIMGFDLFPDVVGFILFALGFQTLARESDHFERAKAMNIVLLLLSLFTIYEPPNTEGGVTVYPIGLIVGILTLGLLLLVVHHLLSGVKDIAGRQGRTDLVEEAGREVDLLPDFPVGDLALAGADLHTAALHRARFCALDCGYRPRRRPDAIHVALRRRAGGTGA